KGIAKLKLKGAFETFEWDFVNVNQSPGSIIAALEKSDSPDVVAQLVALNKQQGKIDWALFYKPLGASSGFYLRGVRGGLVCEPATVDEWIGELRSLSAGREFTKKRVVGQAPGSVYEQFGLLDL
ncbi:MAG: hypothetical protein KDD62_15535, partial [Bdellovibrionales bacterium]|nr:hypothetical protein [Bdellovibrionales bacterium]